MDVLTDLVNEIEEKRNGKKSQYFENLIEEILMNGDDDDNLYKISNKYHCSIGVQREKHNQLQYTFYYDITSDLYDIEINLEVEDGINNGTQLNGYSFENTLEPSSRTVEILDDIELDEDFYLNSHLSVEKARLIFPRYKEKIKKLISNKNYDDYVTGGGTSKTDEYYKSELDEIRDFGIHWICIYKKIEVDLNLV